MYIATWNVNSIAARLELALEWIKEKTPDIILLQEIKCIAERFPHDTFADLGYNLAINGQKSYNGVAILSKHPLEDVHYGFPEFEDTAARYVEAFTNGVRVASVYVPNGQDLTSDKFPYKLAFFHKLKEHLQALIAYKEKCLVGGDFNVAPTDADVYDPTKFKERILSSTPERVHFQQLLDVGFQDLIRVLHPENDSKKEDFFTWWDYRTGAWHRNHGVRIDHFLASPLAVEHVKAVGVDKEWRGKKRPSDHVPVWCELI